MCEVFYVHNNLLYNEDRAGILPHQNFSLKIAFVWFIFKICTTQEATSGSLQSTELNILFRLIFSFLLRTYFFLCDYKDIWALEF